MAKTSHGTLTANAVTTVNIKPGEEGVLVLNRDLAGEIWVRLDGTDPGIGADDSYVVIGSREFPLDRRTIAKQSIAVKLIADADHSYSVEAIQ